MAVYFFRKMQEPSEQSLNARVGHYLCEDPWFALYILILAFELVWVIMGSVWESQSADDESCDSLGPVSIAVVVLTWIYLCVGSTVFCCAWCCNAFNEESRRPQHGGGFMPSVFGFSAGRASGGQSPGRGGATMGLWNPFGSSSPRSTGGQPGATGGGFREPPSQPQSRPQRAIPVARVVN
eukprot:CAMPEP_0172650990 /NCGR_PEP_ID=MMETSP1068-20121228/242578_1 /TAXON_ID=35684 /ORGANISM="Pseudopedinella elastica, Strain CCMP716" /LENGTH=180 /DNA_ID=CAMNT_0013465371 /DNA_START=671 /DNA_END=1213 /DNA_ORIENTATION=+